MFQLSGQTNQKHANIEFIIRFPFLTNNGIVQREFYSFASFRIHGSQVMQLFNGYTSDALSSSKMVRKPSSQTSEEASKKCIILCLVPFPRFRVKRQNDIIARTTRAMNVFALYLSGFLDSTAAVGNCVIFFICLLHITPFSC